MTQKEQYAYCRFYKKHGNVFMLCISSMLKVLYFYLSSE